MQFCFSYDRDLSGSQICTFDAPVDDWVIVDEGAQVSTVSCGQNGGKAHSLEILQERTTSIDIAMLVLPYTMELQSLRFFYREWITSTGGGIRLLNDQGKVEVGIATDNPQLIVQDKQSFHEVHGGPRDPRYGMWVRVEVECHWSSRSLNVTWTRMDDDSTLHTY